MRGGPKLDQLPRDTVLGIRSELQQYRVVDAYSFTEPNPGEESYHWTEYGLKELETDATAWLSVEFDDGEWAVVLFTQQVELSAVGYRRGDSFPDEVAFEGRTFVMDESGKLVAHRVGTQSTYRGQYADYVSQGGHVLSIEAYPDPTNTPRETDVEIWVGKEVEPSSLEIMEASAEKAPHLTPLPLPEAAREMPPPERRGSMLQTATSRPLKPVVVERVERRVNTLTDGAQRTLVYAGAGVLLAVAIILILVL